MNIPSLLSFLRDESGTTIVEYGIAASLIGVVSIASLSLLGDELNSAFVGICRQVDTTGCPDP